jgi:hypothetical protein
VIRSARCPARATAKKVSTAPMASFIALPPGLVGSPGRPQSTAQ